MKKYQNNTADRRGAMTVEFALCLPILMSILFGILEFSRVTQIQQTARLAAFEGARAGIALDAATSDVTTAVNTVMAATGITSFATTLSPSSLAYTTPTISVTVSVAPTNNAWFTWFTTSSSLITANVTLIREVQAVSVP